MTLSDPLSENRLAAPTPPSIAGTNGSPSSGGATSVVDRTLTSLATPRSRTRKIAVRSIIAATGILLVATLLVAWFVQHSMRELIRKSMDTVLAANVASLELWLHQRGSDATRVAHEESVHATAHELLATFGSQPELNPAELLAAPASEDLANSVTEAIATNDCLGWVLLDTQSRMIASSHAKHVGQTLPLPPDVMPRLIEAQTTVSRPFKSMVPIGSTGSLSTNDAPVMVAVAPISEGARLAGALGLLLDPHGDFTEILQAAQFGESGETYAFDRDGLLLSGSRFEDQLRRGGLLPSDKNIASELNTYVRDPGVDIRYDNISAAEAGNAKLTWMADHATRGATGSTVDGYRGYRGIPVIGSWTWIHDYEMGVTNEVDYVEAYAPMQIMKQAFYSLLGLISFLGLGLLAGISVLRWLAKRRPVANRKLGQYDLGTVIGQGGMGSVYRGYHELLRRDVAIKVLERSEATPRSLTRFEREVRMTAGLRHPNTIDIYDYGRTQDGTFFYVMEYVDGISLQQLVAHYGRLPAERVIYLLMQICGSLSEAHHQSLVHRDVKPANVLITSRAGIYDMVKVLDFGLVKEVQRETTQLTQSSAITGTPLYMSPEAVRDASLAVPQSDVYSVGAIGYFLLTGLPTFDGDSPADICAKQLHQQPLRCDKRIGQTLPEDLQNVLMSCLRKDISERPVSMDELAEALLQCKNAHAWTPADACQWWEQVYVGPRDEDVDFADNHMSGNSSVDSISAEDRTAHSAEPVEDH